MRKSYEELLRPVGNLSQASIKLTDGVVHLYEGDPADKTKLIVTVPVEEFQVRFMRWVHAADEEPIVFFDHVNKSQCIIRRRLETSNDGLVLDVDISWHKRGVTGNLLAMIIIAEINPVS